MTKPRLTVAEKTAIIALISAVTVAVVGVIGTALSSYLALQAVQAPIVIPLQATQTAEARGLLTTALPVGIVTPTVTVPAPATVIPTDAPTLAPPVTPTNIPTKTNSLPPTVPSTQTSGPLCRTRSWCALRSTGNNGDQFCEDVFEVQPQPVSSIAITMAKRKLSDLGYSIWEVEAYETITSTTNLISTTGGIQTTATSIEDDRRQPLYAIDQDMKTRWASAWSDKPDGKDPQVLVIKFPQPLTVGRMVIKWEKSYALDYCVAINSGE